MRCRLLWICVLYSFSWEVGRDESDGRVSLFKLDVMDPFKGVAEEVLRYEHQEIKIRFASLTKGQVSVDEGRLPDLLDAIHLIWDGDKREVSDVLFERRGGEVIWVNDKKDRDKRRGWLNKVGRSGRSGRYNEWR